MERVLARALRAPDGGEKDASDQEEVVGELDHRAVDEVPVVEDEDELRDVEQYREHKVEDGDPEQGFEAFGVRV